MRNRLFAAALAGLLLSLHGCSCEKDSKPFLEIATESFPQALLGVSYSHTPAAKNGSTPYTWSVPAGSLPPGLSLNASTGEVSGVPTALGSSTFTLRVSDSGSAFADRSFTIVVAAPPLAITTKQLPFAQIGAAYSVTLQCTGATGPVTWGIVGTPPLNISLDAAGGALTGVASGTASPAIFDVNVTDGVNSDTQSLAIELDPQNLTLLPVTKAGGPGFFTSVGAAFSSLGGLPLSQTTVIEIQDDGVYDENLDLSFSTQTGSEWLSIRSAFDRLPEIRALNASDHVIHVQSPNVEIRGLMISGATGACGVKIDDAASTAIVVNCPIFGCDTGIESGTAAFATLVNNTIHCAKGINASGGASCAVENNVVHATGLYALRSTSFASDYNLLYAPSGSIGTDGVNNYTTLLAWRVATGQDLHSREGDPVFEAPGTFDYRLQASSPGVDGGMKTANTPVTDAEGYARSQGAGMDIGAFERAP